jgi:hypothetical protein
MMASRLIGAGAAVLVLVGIVACERPEGPGEAVEYTVMGPGTYESFVKNWDGEQAPALYAYIGSEREWGEVFQAAATMKADQVFGPEAGFFGEKGIVVLARVVKASGAGEKSRFTVEGVRDEGGELVVRVGFELPDGHGTYEVKDFVGVAVSKRDYTEVRVIENGAPVGTLNLAAGEWSVPGMGADLNRRSQR